jgi:predicted alpha-1,6-mannanase (GH76 family)
MAVHVIASGSGGALFVGIIANYLTLIINDLPTSPCVTGVAARIGLDPLGAQEDGRGSIRTAI